MIADFIINEAQEQSISGFQYISMIYDIEDYFDIKINGAELVEIEEELWNREEVADVIVEDDCFDIVLYTDYAPNYDSQEYEEVVI